MRKWILVIIIVLIALLLGRKIVLEDPLERHRAPIGQTTLKSENKAVFEARRKDVRNVTPSNILAAPELEGDRVERLPTKKLPPPPPRPPKPVIWLRPVVVAAGILKSNDTTIKMADITALPLKKTCIDRLGNHWPCGMFARTALRQFIRGRSIECALVENQNAGAVSTRCLLAGYDISAWIVWQGWALPDNGLFEKELAEAKNKGRGQWRKRAPGR